MKILYLGKFSRKLRCIVKPVMATSELWEVGGGAAGLRRVRQHTLGTAEVSLSLLLAGTRAPRRVAQVPLALGNQAQDRLVVHIHDQALFGRGVGALGSGLAWSAKKRQLSAVGPAKADLTRSMATRQHSPRSCGQPDQAQTMALVPPEVKAGLGRTTGDGEQGSVMSPRHPARAEPH